MNPEISTYIQKRYHRWLDYSRYHSARAGFNGCSIEGDIMNEVMISLINKDPEKLIMLYKKRKGQYRELDFYVLNMIKRNAHSPTAPFRHKYKNIPRDANLDPWTMEIPDRDYNPEEDPSGRILGLTHFLRAAISWTYLTPEERLVCELYFLGDMEVMKSSQKLGLPYSRAREARIQGTLKIRSTMSHLLMISRTIIKTENSEDSL